MKHINFSGMRVTVMGLGLHGGGIETTRFLARHGAEVTVTDLRDEVTLAPSLEKLAGVRFRTVLGKHENADFSDADMVIKNPAVRPNNPYLSQARRIETDLSLFFSLIDNPVIAVTGSKGKSTTASAIHFGLLEKFPNARIGGNITISPLSFLDQLNPGDPIVMELSSFQLGDLAKSTSFLETKHLGAFPPFISIVTNIFHDHQDYYGNMESYVADKEVIFRFQRRDQHSIFCVDDEYGRSFAGKSPSTVWRTSAVARSAEDRSAWLEESSVSSDPLQGPSGWLRDESPTGGDTKALQVLDEKLAVSGRHHRMNLLYAATALHIMGVDAAQIRRRLAAFSGVEHRLETIIQWNGITFINDSAATIPEAALGAVSSLNAPIHLITGGTDKALHFDLFPKIRDTVQTMSLLKGSASEKIAALLAEQGRSFSGPWDNLELCVRDIVGRATSGDVIILSPGCASFGMFLNEFDRGNQFRDIVRKITG